MRCVLDAEGLSWTASLRSSGAILVNFHGGAGETTNGIRGTISLGEETVMFGLLMSRDQALSLSSALKRLAVDSFKQEPPP